MGKCGCKARGSCPDAADFLRAPSHLARTVIQMPDFQSTVPPPRTTEHETRESRLVGFDETPLRTGWEGHETEGDPIFGGRECLRAGKGSGRSMAEEYGGEGGAICCWSYEPGRRPAKTQACVLLGPLTVIMHTIGAHFLTKVDLPLEDLAPKNILGFKISDIFCSLTEL